MKDILEKLKKIKETILSEQTGRLRLFVLIKRTDLVDKWDIIFSADWLEKTNSERDLIYIIEKLKEEFPGNLDFLASIITVTPNEIFTKELAKAIQKEGFGELKEINNLSIPRLDITGIQLYMIALDFSVTELEAEGNDEGPLAVRETSEF